MTPLTRAETFKFFVLPILTVLVGAVLLAIVLFGHDNDGEARREPATPIVDVMKDGKFFQIERPDGTLMWCVRDPDVNTTGLLGPFDCDWSGIYYR